MERSFETLLNDLLHKDRLPFKRSKQQAWSRINAQISSATVVPLTSSGREVRTKWAIAAGFALMIASAVVLYLFTAEVSQKNEGLAATNITLPDGSAVWLNSGAALSYNRYLFKWRRKIQMKGEAFYDVTKGTVFHVHTSSGYIEVLGTSFNVTSQDDRLEVAVRSGKVRVGHDSGEEVLLTPGKVAKLDAGTLRVTSQPLHTIGSWTELNYAFIDAELVEVLEKLTHDTGYTFRFEGKSVLRYTGTFSRNEDIENMMAIICRPMGLDFAIDRENKIVIIQNN